MYFRSCVLQCSVTFTACVQQGRLETDIIDVKIILDRDLNTKSSVWVDVWKRQEIGGSNEEVAMESVYAETCCAASATRNLLNTFNVCLKLKSQTKSHFYIAVNRYCTRVFQTSMQFIQAKEKWHIATWKWLSI